VKVGGITTVESAIHLSNVMLVDGDGKATRIGARKDDAGKNVRISRRSGKDA
jgi:large subunit ribosomal protein L24